jgi:ribosomal protein S18 acetylase RimI-like enzyme
LEKRDLEEISSVHRAAFSKSALTALGPETVRRYYEWLLDDLHDSFCLGAWRGERLEGFIFAGHFLGAMVGFINRNKGYLMARTAFRPWLIANAEFRQRMLIGWRALSMRRRWPAPTATVMPNHERPAVHFGVLSIAAHPRVWGTGVAEALMARADREAVRRGVETMILTVHPTNTRAVRFYERLGWEKIPVSGAWDGLMHKKLRAPFEERPRAAQEQQSSRPEEH